MSKKLTFVFCSKKSKIIVSEDKSKITYEVVGNSFMYKQVRCMVGALVEIGLGKMSLETFSEMIEKGIRQPIPGAPPQGLTLIWVEHDENIASSDASSSMEIQVEQ
jgi:tRNA pseudouridine(38-40) synthase